jgi:hypothetical protein
MSLFFTYFAKAAHYVIFLVSLIFITWFKYIDLHLNNHLDYNFHKQILPITINQTKYISDI